MSVKQQRLLSAAGIVMLVGAALPIVWLASAFSGLAALQFLIRSNITRVLMPLPFFGLAIGFGGNTDVSNWLALFFLWGIIMAIFGGILTLSKKRRGWAAVGILGTLLCTPVFGLASLILTVISRPRLKPGG
jgi:hypothetical protein